MLISLRNARRRDQGAAAYPQQAIAARDAAVRCFRNRLPSCARAQRANFGCCFHNSLLYSLLCGVDSTLHPEPLAPQGETGFQLCTSCGERRRVVENREKEENCRAADRRQKASKIWRFRAHLPITADATLRFGRQNRLPARVSH